MAMMDYGVIAKINGKIVTKSLFTPMKDTMGISIEKADNGSLIDGNEFVFLGDRDFYIGIYKGYITIYNNTKVIHYISDLYHPDWIKGIKYRHKETVNGVEFDIKRIDKGNRYYGRFIYKENCYEFIYGYGVDVDIDCWYDKSNRVINKVERFYRNAK